VSLYGLTSGSSDPLDVDRNIPYLTADGVPGLDSGDPVAVAAHCGIEIHGDRIQVSFPFRQYRAWAVAPASSVRGRSPTCTEGSGASESDAEAPPVGDAEPERDEERMKRATTVRRMMLFAVTLAPRPAFASAFPHPSARGPERL
jgi:hypothetical protein